MLNIWYVNELLETFYTICYHLMNYQVTI